MKRSRTATTVPASGLVAFLLLAPIAALAADNGAADFAKGWDLLKLKKYQEARTVLEAGMKKNPTNALAHFYLADACRGLKDWTCAEEHYETSLELDGKSSVTDLAKTRLRKAKVWRLLEDAKRSSEEGEASPEKHKKAHEMLEIAKALGLEDEQQATYDLLIAKLQKVEQEANAPKEKQVTLSVDETLVYIQEAIQQTFSMSGSFAKNWRLSVSEDGTLIYSVEGRLPMDQRQVFRCEKGKDEIWSGYKDYGNYVDRKLHYKVPITALDPSDVHITQEEGNYYFGIGLNCKNGLTCVNLYQAESGQCNFGTKIYKGRWERVKTSRAFDKNELLDGMRILLGGNTEPTGKLIKAFSHLIKKADEENAQRNKSSPF